MSVNQPISNQRCRAQDPAKCRVHGALTPEILNRQLDNIDKNFRPTIGLDLDGVTFQYEDGLRQDQMKKTGLPAEHYPLAKDYSTVKSGWPFKTEDEFRKAHAEAVDDGLYENLKLIPGAAAALQRLAADGYKIVVITSRFIRPGQHAEVVRQTTRSLDLAGIPYNEISFTSNKPGIVADVYIDDAPYNIDALRAAGRKVVPYGQEYNKDYEGRVVDWTEAEAEIRRLAPLPK